MFLKKSTAATLVIGPFVDDTDGKTPETGLTINDYDVYLFKAGATSESSGSNLSTSVTHLSQGRYLLSLNSTATNTAGLLEINIFVSGALPVKTQVTVLEQSAYDCLITGTDYIKANVKEFTDSETIALWIAGSFTNNGDISYVSADVKLWDSNIAPVSFLSNDGISNIISADFSSCTFPQMQSSIVANGINVNSISSFSLTAAKFGSGAITSTVLANGAITADKFAANAITSTVLADSAITAAKFAASAITATVIATDAITSTQVADGFLTSSKIANNAITSSTIADGSITDAKITVPSVSSGIATGILGMVQQLWRRFFKKVVNDKSNLTIKTYANDGTTVLTTHTYSYTVTTEQVGDAS